VAGRIEWVHDLTRFLALADDWDELARQAPSPFADHAWYRAWWDAFGVGELSVCLLWEGERLRAALPLSKHRNRLTALANYHTPAFLALARDRAGLHELVDEVLARPSDELTLHALETSDPLLAEVTQASDRRRRPLLIEPAHHSPSVHIDGDFETYSTGRSRGFKNVARRWRKVNREHEVRFRFEEQQDDLDRALEVGFEVEAASWKGERGTAVLSTPQTRSFYFALGRAYQASGGLRLLWLDIDGEPAAFSFCLLRDGRLYLLKTGMRESFRSQAAGLVLQYCTVRQCFELGLKSYELLGGDDPYKGHFANAVSDYVRVRSYRRRPRAFARYATRRLGRPLAHAVRTQVDATKTAARSRSSRRPRPSEH
jgi:CelD/BcsL family acetyltransferase involved in cellulose biosynthesis